MAVTVKNLVKTFGTTVAIDDVTFHVDRGVTFALLGTNGAGKSTTINCLTTLLTPDSGEARIFGHDVRTESAAVRNRIGITFQESLLDPLLTGKENLLFRSRLQGIPDDRARLRIEELAEILNFQGFLSRRYGVLSGGQKRRLDIARALLHSPDLLFLDEPTTGLDPASRESVWNCVDSLREGSGLTVFLTTHYMEETERADTVCILDEGHTVITGAPAELRARYSASVLTVTSTSPRELLSAIKRLDSSCARIVGRSQEPNQPISIQVADAQVAREILTEHGECTQDFEFRHGNMDDVFLAVTGKERSR